MTDSPVLDPGVWQSLRTLADDPAFLDELIDLFIDDAIPRVERVRAALAAGDRSAAQAAAHSIKGAAGNIGAVHASALAAAIEDDLDAGLAVGADRAERLADALQDVVRALDAQRSRPRA